MAITQFRGKWLSFSNFSSDAFMWRGKYYETSEHAFQASKACSIQDHERIRQCIGPSESKRLGRKIKKRSDWEAVRIGYMLSILRVKFDPRTDLGILLESTGDEELIEGNNWGDIFWGVCNGIGENHLGKCLMKVRQENREYYRSAV